MIEAILTAELAAADTFHDVLDEPLSRGRTARSPARGVPDAGIARACQ
jgi:hypothetical protein